MLLHYGCGLTAPEDWANFDASPTLRLRKFGLPVGPHWPRNVRYGDIVRGLPVDPGSCELAYCSHVLEHLAYEDCLAALANTFRYLAPGGIFRLVVPDLAHAVGNYHGAHAFMRETMLGTETRARGLARWAQAFGNSRHLWLWDEPAMREALTATGFRDIRRAACGDGDPDFAAVEDPARWAGALGLECRK